MAPAAGTRNHFIRLRATPTDWCPCSATACTEACVALGGFSCLAPPAGSVFFCPRLVSPFANLCLRVVTRRLLPAAQSTPRSFQTGWMDGSLPGNIEHCTSLPTKKQLNPRPKQNPFRRFLVVQTLLNPIKGKFSRMWSPEPIREPSAVFVTSGHSKLIHRSPVSNASKRAVERPPPQSWDIHKSHKITNLGCASTRSICKRQQPVRKKAAGQHLDKPCRGISFKASVAHKSQDSKSKQEGFQALLQASYAHGNSSPKVAPKTLSPHPKPPKPEGKPKPKSKQAVHDNKKQAKLCFKVD